ncbi:MAG: hypothetical protein J0H74_25150 [Chitinophagaceae bacterium]|nr:hypothetical protein [Chitinophagaceae bacterium]
MYPLASLFRLYPHVLRASGLLIAGMQLLCLRAEAQMSSLPHAYAHNDYWHKRPLLDALDNGFTHVEADVYLRHSRLVVSHNPPFFRKKHTLEELYFRPLLQRFTIDGDRRQSSLDTIVLMIDVKSRGGRTIRALEKFLDRYKPILSSYDSGKVTIRNLTLVVTGHRPLAWLDIDGPRYLFVDADLKKLDRRQETTDLYFTASCKYSSLISWKGKGQISLPQQQRLTTLVDRAHSMGAKVRLWASPDKTCVWNFLMSAGVDLINTDKIVALRNYFVHNGTDNRPDNN